MYYSIYGTCNCVNRMLFCLISLGKESIEPISIYSFYDNTIYCINNTKYYSSGAYNIRCYYINQTLLSGGLASACCRGRPSRRHPCTYHFHRGFTSVRKNSFLCHLRQIPKRDTMRDEGVCTAVCFYVLMTEKICSRKMIWKKTV